MPTTQKERKSDVRQLVGILDEFAEEDVRRAVTELGLAGNGAAGLDPGRISLDLPAAVAALDFLPLLFLAVGETVTWAITGEIGGNWQVEVKGVSSSRGGQPYTVGQPGRTRSSRASSRSPTARSARRCKCRRGRPSG
ncbi:MAG TPA: hypothetical protein VD769_00795 [Gaiellaceae bacterium]|nr:hypothetical protein [Gaiellaceae bacterium]